MELGWQGLEQLLACIGCQAHVDGSVLTALLQIVLYCRESNGGFALLRGALEYYEVALRHRPT